MAKNLENYSFLSILTQSLFPPTTLIEKDFLEAGLFCLSLTDLISHLAAKGSCYLLIRFSRSPTATETEQLCLAQSTPHWKTQFSDTFLPLATITIGTYLC